MLLLKIVFSLLYQSLLGCVTSGRGAAAAEGDAAGDVCSCGKCDQTIAVVTSGSALPSRVDGDIDYVSRCC